MPWTLPILCSFLIVALRASPTSKNGYRAQGLGFRVYCRPSDKILKVRLSRHIRMFHNTNERLFYYFI